MEFKEFDINLYFSKKYGMGDKPNEGYLHGQRIVWGVLLIIVGIIVVAALSTRNPMLGLIIMSILVLIGLLIMLPPIFSKKRDKNKADAWQAEFDHRKSTWDHEFDTFLQKKIDEMNLRQTALLKIGITEEQLDDVQPFCISGSVLNGAQNLFRIDSNGVVRADHNEITWLFFSKNQVYLYNIKFRLATNVKTEITKEFFYKDIVSVTIGTELIEVDIKNCVGSNAPKAINAERLKLIVPNDKMSFVFTSKDEIAGSLQSMKNKIRDNKTV